MMRVECECRLRVLLLHVPRPGAAQNMHGVGEGCEGRQSTADRQLEIVTYRRAVFLAFFQALYAVAIARLISVESQRSQRRDLCN